MSGTAPSFELLAVLAAEQRQVYAQCIEAYLVDSKDPAAKLAALSVATGVALGAAIKCLQAIDSGIDVVDLTAREPLLRFVGTATDPLTPLQMARLHAALQALERALQEVRQR
jgi:hypothetical protein